jgi:hypothetical protein
MLETKPFKNMTEITFKLPTEYYAQFLEYVQKSTFPFEIAKVEEKEDNEPTKSEILAGIKEALKEVKLIQKGKKEAVLLKDFLKEF